MSEETKVLEKPEEKEVPFKDLKTWEKIVYILFVGFYSLLNWKSVIGIVLICIYFSSSDERTALGASHEEAYQGGRALYLLAGCLLIGIGAGIKIKKKLS